MRCRRREGAAEKSLNDLDVSLEVEGVREEASQEGIRDLGSVRDGTRAVKIHLIGL